MEGWPKPVQWRGVPLLLGEALRPQAHQREEFDSLVPRGDGIPGRQCFDDLLHFSMGWKRLLRAIQFATQHMCIDSQSVSQFLLQAPCWAASGGHFLTEEREVGRGMYMSWGGHNCVLLSILTEAP